MIPTVYTRRIALLKAYRYVGPSEILKGCRALGRCGEGGVFQVQVDSTTLEIDGEKWGFGWHDSPEDHWAYDLPDNLPEEYGDE